MPNTVDIQINNTILLSIYKKDGSHITVPSRLNNMKIASGSVSLKSAIVDNELVFGQPIASEFSCEIFNLEDDLSGYKITAYLQDIKGLNREAIFTGYIDSCTTDLLGGSRKIIAYDWFYYHRDDNIADYFQSYWWDGNPETLKLGHAVYLARRSFVSYLGFTNISDSFINDNMIIGEIPQEIVRQTTSITVAQYLQMICELQCTFPHINGAGNLEFIKLDIGTITKNGDEYTRTSSTPYILDDTNYEKSNTTREEYITKRIPYMKICESSDKVLYDRIPSTLSDDFNCYTISGNILLNYMYDGSARQAQRLAYFKELTDNMINYCLQWLYYLPNKTKMIISDFSLELGKYYKFDGLDSDCYIMSIELSGECLIEQTISCIAKSETLSNKAATKNDSIVQNNNNISTNSKIESVKEDLENNYYDKDAADHKFIVESDIIMYSLNNRRSNVYREDNPLYDPTEYTWSTKPSDPTASLNYLWSYHIYKYANTTEYTDPEIIKVYGDPGESSIGFNGTDIKQYTINSDKQWIASNRKVDDHIVYESTNHTDDSNGICVIQFTGYTEFTIMACSDGEDNNTHTSAYDYLMISNLDAKVIKKDDTSYKYSFKNTMHSSTDFIPITFSNLNSNQIYTVRLLYTKDGSRLMYTDKAYFYIPEGTCLTENISVINTQTIYYTTETKSYPNPPTSKVVNVATTYNTWSTRMVAPDNTHLYVYSCTQTIYSDGTVNWSIVLLDEASTASFISFKQEPGKWTLTCDDGGNLSSISYGINDRREHEFYLDVEKLNLVASKSLDIKTPHIGIIGDGFSIEAGTGIMTINADYLNFVANKTIDLKTGKIGINSDNFKINAVTGLVDIVGSLTCRDGQISISKNNEEYAMKVETHEGSSKIDYTSYSQSGNGVVNEYTNSVSGEFFEFFNPTSTYGQVSILTNYLYVKSGITAHRINTPYIGAAEGDIQTIYTNDLNVSNKINAANIGNYTVKNSDWTTTDIPNNTLTKLGYITLNQGVWVVFGKIQLSDNIPVNSVLQIGIALNSTSVNSLLNSVASVSGAITYKNISTSNIMNISSNNTKVYLYTRQNSGSTISIDSSSITSTFLKAVQIA